MASPSDAPRRRRRRLTHVNLNDGTVEGLARPPPAFCVQYHPEASPGPHDSLHLFDRFVAEMRRFAAQREPAAAKVS